MCHVGRSWQAAVLVGVLVVGVVAGVSCGPPADAPPDSTPPKAAAVTDGEKAELAQGSNRFAFGLYGQLRAADGNLFFSPVSLTTALAMALAGARGETAAQMTEVLGYSAPWRDEPEEVHAIGAALLADLTGDGRPRAFQLSVANALWGQKGYGFRPEFLAFLEGHYRAGLTELDFAGAPEAACAAINTWAARETRDKIRDLVPAGTLDALTRLVLTNAVYFRGDWTLPFEASLTHDGPFHVTPDRQVAVPMMHQEGKFRYRDGGDFQVLEMTYKGDAVSMVILLPKAKDGLAALEALLTAKRVAAWLDRCSPRDVQVTMPKFRMTSAFRLAAALSAMGMPLAFDSTKADFSGMNGGKEPLWLGAAIHKAFVAVDEKGTEAAAATALELTAAEEPNPPPEFRADHPFVFLIRDVRSGAILFLGRVVDPKADAAADGEGGAR